MDELLRVPCVRIDRNNINSCFDRVIESLKKATFVAIDLELSGLGDKSLLNTSDIEERYLNVSKIAKSHSIISVGLSIFRCQNSRKRLSEEDTENQWNFLVENYDMTTFCTDEYVMEEEALNFLSSYGFDFNNQRAFGLQYSKGDQSHSKDDKSIHNIILTLIGEKIPIVFHNGLIDIIFLYECFIASLPKTLDIFVANLYEIFPYGIFDTKLIARSLISPPFSYLAYVFYQSQRDNLVRKAKGQAYISTEYPDESVAENDCEYRSLQTNVNCDKQTNQSSSICSDYKNHGWCKHWNDCEKSHNMDTILDEELSINMRKIFRKLNSINKLENEKKEIKREDEAVKPAESGSCIHRAGYDAFMTGYCFASIVVRIVVFNNDKQTGKSVLLSKQLGKYRHKIYLTGKNEPLRIRNSVYCQSSIKFKSIIKV